MYRLSAAVGRGSDDDGPVGISGESSGEDSNRGGSSTEANGGDRDVEDGDVATILGAADAAACSSRRDAKSWRCCRRSARGGVALAVGGWATVGWTGFERPDTCTNRRIPPPSFSTGHDPLTKVCSGLSRYWAGVMGVG